VRKATNREVKLEMEAILYEAPLEDAREIATGNREVEAQYEAILVERLKAKGLER
jgi:hypothetical protein